MYLRTKLIALLMFCCLHNNMETFAQEIVDFENLSLSEETYWLGEDQAGGFESGSAYFPNVYSQDFFYWASGWAYSNSTDSITSGYLNLHSAKTGGGVYGSTTYAIGQQGSIIQLTDEAAGAPIAGLYITNSTYAHNSMRDGDDFAKQFGGEDGTEPDFFKLSVQKYYEGELGAELVEFYLADYRFEDSAEDYIVDSWEWLDLSSLGNTDSLVFTLTSSDIGDVGINTPLFFCIDQLTPEAVSSINTPLDMGDKKVFTMVSYPNPIQEQLQVSIQYNNAFLAGGKKEGILSITNAFGQTVFLRTIQEENSPIVVNTLNWAVGVYTVQVQYGNNVQTTKVLRK